MTVTEIEAKSILRKHKKIDSWFISHYGMNLYRGCHHGCVYCDGRAEGYYTQGDFGEDVYIKTNAIEILRRELDPARKRKPMKRSFIILGGGVGDSYQPVESKYKLTRGVLELLLEYGYPVHVLTKSTLVTRDIDILKEINTQSRVIVSFSFSSTDNEIAGNLEPGVPSPTQRLETLALFKKEGIACGMFLLPVVPFITDADELIEDSIRKASEIGLDFIIFGGMTLKEGQQQDHFMSVIRNNYPVLAGKYREIYPGNRWGQATAAYYDRLNRQFCRLVKQYPLPVRIPSRIYSDILSENDLVIVVLEHIDYLQRLKGKKSSFGYAAYSISRLEQPLSSMKKELRTLKGVNGEVERTVLEIMETGTSSYYTELLCQ